MPRYCLAADVVLFLLKFHAKYVGISYEGFANRRKCGIMIAGKFAKQIFTASLFCALRSCIIDGFAKTKDSRNVTDILGQGGANEASDIFV